MNRIGLAVLGFAFGIAVGTGLFTIGSSFAESPRAATTNAASVSSSKQSNQRLKQPERIEHSYPLASDDDRAHSARLVQQLTVDLLAIQNIYKEAHWNLTGPLYLVLHEYFDEQAKFYNQQADTFAERALHLGYSIDGRYSTIAKTTTIPDFPAGYLTDAEAIRLLVDRVTVLQKEIYQDVKETEKGDPTTSNKLQDLAYAVDKNLWQLRAHVQQPGGAGENLPWTAPMLKGGVESIPFKH